jgi:MFS transporter, putative metabolite:H+ symporter
LQERMIDLNEIIEDIGVGRFHLLQQFLLAGTRMADGAEVLISSCVLAVLQSEWHLTPVLKGFMMSIIFVGVACGSFFGGYLADAFGRRKAILGSYIGLIIFGTLTATTQGPWQMVAARFCFGISYGLGVGPSVTLQVETCPKAWRGHMVNLGSIFFTTGGIFAAVLLLVFIPDLDENRRLQVKGWESWRYVTALAACPALIILPFAALLLHESPHFLVANNRHAEAVQTVKSMAYQNGTEQVVAPITADSEVPSARPAASERSRLLPDQASRQVTTSSPPGESRAHIRGFRDVVLNEEYKYILLGGSYLCFLANFLFIGLTYAMPQVLRTLKQKLQLSMHPAYEILLLTFCDFPGIALAALCLRDKEFGHRTCLTIVSLLMGLLLLCHLCIDEGVYYVALPAAYLNKLLSGVYFTISYVYLTEVFPSAYRASASSICMGAGRLGSIIAPVVFEMLKNMFWRPNAAFWIFSAVLCFIGCLSNRYLLTFELKGEPLEDVVNDGGRLGLCRPSLLAHQEEDAFLLKDHPLEDGKAFSSRRPSISRPSTLLTDSPAVEIARAA